MDPLVRMEHIMRAKTDPKEFLHDKYFLDIPKPYPVQEEVFTTFFTGGYKELDLAKGMGGGGTFLGALFICYDLFDLLIRSDPARDFGLASHSHITQLCVAKSDDQAADTIYGEVRTKIEHSPFFQEYYPKIKEYNTTFLGHPDLEIMAIGAASAGSSVGRNVKTVFFDEIDSYDETATQRGAWQVYSRIRKSTNRFGYDGHVGAISSPWHVNSIIMQLTAIKDDSRILTRRYATWEMNPLKPFDSPEMQSELEKDPITFWRDYGVDPHSNIAAFYPDVSIVRMNKERENALEPISDENLFGRIRHLPQNQTYVLAIDPGLVNDAFGVALLHKEQQRVIADGLWRFKPEKTRRALDPIEIKQYLVGICKVLPVRYLITDQWYYVEAIQEIQKLGVQVQFKPNRKEEHDAVRNAWFEDELEICNYPYILTEFEQLLVLDSRRMGVIRGGKIDVIDALTRGYWACKELFSTNFTPNVVVVI